MSGWEVVFEIVVVVVVLGLVVIECVEVCVCFCILMDVVIECYLFVDQFYDCVGSVKVESLGVVLLEVVEFDDLMVFIGLFFICICVLLCWVGLDLLV